MATSVGAQANASGFVGTAVGYQSVASGNSATAVGRAAAASGFQASAVGYQAQASHSNATAVGASATTTANNQVALGGTGSSVKVGDIDASTAAQQGPVYAVTVDATGTLGRSSTVSTAQLETVRSSMIGALAVSDAQFDALSGRVEGLEEEVGVLFDLATTQRKETARASPRSPPWPARTSRARPARPATPRTSATTAARSAFRPA